MTNILKIFLDVANNQTSELGKNWEAFEIFTIFICVLPWLGLIVYLIFFKRYKIRYFVGEEEIFVQEYKPKEVSVPYEYQNNKIWYIDIECENEFVFGEKLTSNIKLYKKVE